MKWPGKAPPQRLGLLGETTDPVLQLLEDVPGLAQSVLVPIHGTEADAQVVDEIFAPDQDVALAHLRFLRNCGRPVSVLLRRRGPLVAALEWQIGMDWLKAVLDEARWDHLRLLALGPEAAEELTAFLGHPVIPLAPLAPIGTPRPLTPVRRDEEVLTFSLTLPDGQRDIRRAMLECFNWVRLRRLGALHPGDEDDPDLHDLTGFAEPSTTSHVPTDAPGRAAAPCILAVIPNGTGLGHLTRVLAVARALEQGSGARVVFWSFSRAAQIIEAAGFEVILRQTCPHLGAHPPDWRQWETLEFASTVRRLKARAVIYDGGTLDHFISDGLRSPGCGHCGLVWIRRGMLQPETDAQLLETEQYCDLVLEPGDLAVEEDKGPTRTRKAQNQGFSRFLYTPPVTLKAFLPDYEARPSRKRLKLGRGRHCLVSLGGAFGNWDELVNTISQSARRNRVKLIWARSPLAPAPTAGDDRAIRQFFPLSPYMAAFDGVISATGYNSFHELLLHYDGPVLFAPTNNDRLDDQEARARHSEHKGWASVVYGDKPEEQAAVIERFMAGVRRRERVEGRPREDYGAVQMAEAILEVAARYEPEGEAR